MKTIGYICSYNSSSEISLRELSKQKEDIKKFCDTHQLELHKIYTESSNTDDLKPVLLNIMSTEFGYSDTIIIQSPDIISRNTDFRNWVLDEFSRIKLKVIFIKDTEQTLNSPEKNLTSITEKIKNIPSLPEIITKSIELMQDQNVAVKDLATLISNDIGLTARVLKIVNSSYYGFPKQITTIQQAINILGFTTLKGIILSASIFKMFPAKSNQIFNYKEFWKYSIITATAAKLIKNICQLDLTSDIFSAAFLHDIGKIILAQYDWENYSKVYAIKNYSEGELLKAEADYCGLNHCEIANLVAYSWNLPEIFCDIITYHHNPENSLNFKNECKIVKLANIITQCILNNEEFHLDNITLDLLENLKISVENITKAKEELTEIALNTTNINEFLT